jgi:hypothetical protein
MATMLDSPKGPDHWYVAQGAPQNDASTAARRWECRRLFSYDSELCRHVQADACTSALSSGYLLIQTDLPPPGCT